MAFPQNYKLLKIIPLLIAAFYAIVETFHCMLAAAHHMSPVEFLLVC